MPVEINLLKPKLEPTQEYCPRCGVPIPALTELCADCLDELRRAGRIGAKRRRL